MVRRRATSPEVDAIDVELIAIGVMGKALTPLDAEARVRVLRWANERFQPDSSAPVQVPAPTEEQPLVPALRLAPEPDLTVDGLDNLCEVPADLFDQPADRLVGAPADLVRQPATLVGHPADLVEDPAEPAATLSLAPTPDLTVDYLNDMFEMPADLPPAGIAEAGAVVPSAAEDLSDVYEAAPEPARPLLHFVPREELPFDQLVDDFVDSVRRLTRDWQDV